MVAMASCVTMGTVIIIRTAKLRQRGQKLPMATQTQVLKRNTVQAGRIHDYLYGTCTSWWRVERNDILRMRLSDPAHTLSGVRDHARETFIARTGTEQLVSCLIHRTFSTRAVRFF